MIHALYALAIMAAYVIGFGVGLSFRRPPQS